MSYPAPIFTWSPMRAKSLHPKAVFTRASAGRVNPSTGVLAAAGNNVIRLDHDPATGLEKGFLVEESRTNLLTYSEQFDNVAWQKGALQAFGLGSVINAIVAPDGTISADKIAVDGSTAVHYLTQNQSGLVAGGTYCWAVYVKANEISRIQLSLDNGVSAGCVASFNLGTKAELGASAWGTGATYKGSGIQELPQGWFRIWVSGIVDNSATTLRGLLVPMAIDGTGYAPTTTFTAGSSFYIFGAQLEAGSFPTSYIPTTAAAVTRSADVCTMALSNLVGPHGEPLWNGAEGTLFAHVEYCGAGASDYVLALNDGSYANLVTMQMLTSTRAYFSVLSGGGYAVEVNMPSVTPTSKMAFTFKANDFAACVNSGAVSTDTSGAVPVSLTTMAIGRNNIAGTNGNWRFRQIALWNRRLSNADLQALTAA